MSHLAQRCVTFSQFLLTVIRTFFRDQGVINAAALTYTTLFSIVPLMTVSYAMLAAIPSSQEVGVQIEGWVFENFLPNTGIQIQEHLAGFANQAKSLTVVGALFLFITALLMMKNIESAFNRIWKVKTTRSGVRSFLTYWAVLTLGPILVGAGIVLSSYLVGVTQLDSFEPISGFKLLNLLPWLMTAGAFALIYAVIPNAHVPAQAAIISGLVAALLFELAKRGFALFVAYSPSYQLIYGAFAAVPLFLVWIYLSWCVVLLGAVLSRILTYGASEPRSSKRWFIEALRIIELLYKVQQRGGELSEKAILSKLTGLKAEVLHEVIQRCRALSLFTETAQGTLILKRDLHSLTLADIYELDPLPVLEHCSQTAWQADIEQRFSRLKLAREEIFAVKLSELFSN